MVSETVCNDIWVERSAADKGHGNLIMMQSISDRGAWPLLHFLAYCAYFCFLSVLVQETTGGGMTATWVSSSFLIICSSHTSHFLRGS